MLMVYGSGFKTEQRKKQPRETQLHDFTTTNWRLMTYQTGREFLVRQRAAWQEDVGDQALDGGTHLSRRVSRVYEVSEVNQSHLPPAHLLASQ